MSIPSHTFHADYSDSIFLVYIQGRKNMFFFIPDEPFLRLAPYETLTPAECPDGLKINNNRQ